MTTQDPLVGTEPLAVGGSVSLSPCLPVSLSGVRAWFALVWLSLQRQARMRQMVWIALSLLVFAAAFVAVWTAADRWNMGEWHWLSRKGPTFRQTANNSEAILLGMPDGGRAALAAGLVEGVQVALDQSPFRVFTTAILVGLYLSFLLPIWTLSFAVEALGGERENNSLVWLLSRPLPRPAIYLAKFVALLPWVLGFNGVGFVVLCLLAGPPGREALRLFWPVVIWTSLAFAALFHAVGASFRRPAVVAILYVFFLEIILNLMPGYLKRVSISYYSRCLMIDTAGHLGIHPENPVTFLAVSGSTALVVLLAITVGLLLVGMLLFTRKQYQDTV